MRESPSLLLKAHSVLMSFQSDSSHFGKTSNQLFLYGTTTTFLQINYFPCIYWSPGTLALLHFFTSHLKIIKHSNRKVFNIHSRISSMSLIKLIAINRMLYFNLISSINLFHYFMVNLSWSLWWWHISQCLRLLLFSFFFFLNGSSTFVFPLLQGISGLNLCQFF